MATKDAKRTETMALRSSRRYKSSDTTDPKTTNSDHCLNLAPCKDPSPPIEDHKQQQITPKNEKQSTTLLNNQPLPLLLPEDTSRRVTRSSIVTSKKICSQPDLHIEALTPEDNPISKLSDQPTSKKLGRVVSGLSLSEAQEGATARKSVAKVGQNLVSPYSQVRKSYRRSHRSEIRSIPYRKCHDAFEGRIVAIINKMGTGKNCLRDLEGLLDRLLKINTKDMLNRYVVGGIATIVRLAREGSQDSQLVDKLDAELRRLKLRIVTELQTYDLYEHSQPNNQQLVDCQKYKSMLIRKLYRLTKYRGGGKQAREKVVRQCEQLVNCERDLGNVIKFFRETCFLQE